MRVLVFLLGILLTFVSDELVLRLRLLVRPRNAAAFLSAFQHARSRQVVAWAGATCGFRLRVAPFPGTMPTQCLVVANHQSLLDIPVLMHSLPSLDLRFVAKRELRRRLPMVSTLLRSARHALIGRKTGLAQAERELRKLAELTRQGVSPIVFPEGTRSRTGEVGRFHAAGVRVLAARSGLPILSVAVEGGWRIAGFRQITKSLVGASYRVAPLTLYPPAGTRQELAATLDAARAEIVERLRRWRTEEAAAKIG